MKNQQQEQLHIYNSIHRKSELFKPIKAPFVGLYVCGPTVYGDAHLGHARPAITFDIVFRYLQHIGYKVRYVRNITDVGHLENDADDGEDKIAKKARLEELEPMEVVQHFTDRYHHDMLMLNVKSPSIEPRASGHILEQIEMVEEILKNGYAYESNGSVYFDVVKYNKDYAYGKLSGRKIEDLLENTRTLAGQDEKRESVDFAIWKKADSRHIMRWNSPWGAGFPGWHMECSAMSSKYLGEQFDIHGGGLDLQFPHHESEIAQSVACHGKEPVNYWMHNNMITINGQKMGKSLGNFITLEEFFTGDHEFIEEAYDPMTIRFFILQAQYRSTLDFSNAALQAAKKGYQKLAQSYLTLNKLSPSANSEFDFAEIENKCYQALNNDFNTPILIAHLFELVKIINSANDGKLSLSANDIQKAKEIYDVFMIEIMGLNIIQDNNNENSLDKVMDLIIEIRKKSREEKNWDMSDKIRNSLAEAGIQIKDGKDGSTWNIK